LQVHTVTSLQHSTVLFLLANTVQIELRGEPSGTALYNLACAASLLAAAGNNHHANLQKSLNWLLQSAVAHAPGAAYKSRTTMNSDSDLTELRTRNPTGFQQAISLAKTTFNFDAF
jgi:hypothetical protein